MKFDSKFKLGLHLSWQTLVAPDHNTWLRLLSPLPMDEVEAYLFLD
jgi:hypothetical protein